MTVYYSTNWMGPINPEWIAKNGPGWSAGRIDIYDSSCSGYCGNAEIALPAMRTIDWALFSEWLRDFESENVLELKDIVQEYEKTYPEIEWWKKETEK